MTRTDGPPDDRSAEESIGIWTTPVSVIWRAQIINIVQQIIGRDIVDHTSENRSHQLRDEHRTGWNLNLSGQPIERIETVRQTFM